MGVLTEAHQEVGQSKDIGFMLERSLTARALSSNEIITCGGRALVRCAARR